MKQFIKILLLALGCWLLADTAGAQMPGVDIRPPSSGLGVVRYSNDNMTSNFTPSTSVKPVALYDWCFDGRRGSWFYYNGSSWQARGLNNGMDADLSYTQTNVDSLTSWDASLYNRALLNKTSASSDTIYIDEPSNYASQIPSETFCIEVNNNRVGDADTMVIRFDSLFRTYDGNLFTWRIPPRARQVMTFRVTTSIEGVYWLNTDDILGSYGHTSGGGGGFTGVDTLANFSDLRAYTGTANAVYVQSDGIQGLFVIDRVGTSDDNAININATDGRNWKRIFYDVVNVKWFGATGDGVTSDETAIDNFFTYLNTSGNETKGYFPRGIYMTSSATGTHFSISRNGVEIFGDGIGQTTIKQSSVSLSANSTILSVTGYDNYIHDIGFDNAAKSGAKNVYQISIGQGAFRTAVERCEFTGAWGAETAGGSAIETYQQWNTTEYSSTLGSTIAAGTRTVQPASMKGVYVGQRIVVGGTTETVYVTAATDTTFTAVFANSHNSSDAITIYAQAEQRVLIDRCWFHDAPQSCGIVLNSSYNIVGNCKFERVGTDVTEHAIYNQGGHNQFLNNYFEGIRGYSIHSHKQVANVDGSGDVVSGNQFKNCQSVSVYYSTLNNTSNPEIPTGYPLTRYVTISNNVFNWTNPTITAPLNAISVACPAVISNNVIEDYYSSTGGGIISATADSNVITGNQIIKTVYANPSGTNVAGISALGSRNIISSNVVEYARIQTGKRGVVSNCSAIGIQVGYASIVQNSIFSISTSASVISGLTSKTRFYNCDFVSAAQVVQISSDVDVIFENCSFTQYIRPDATLDSVRFVNCTGKVARGGNVATNMVGKTGILKQLYNVGSSTIDLAMKLTGTDSVVLVTTSDKYFSHISITSNVSNNRLFFIQALPGVDFTGTTDGTWTKGNYAILSATTAGRFHDAGTTRPGASYTYGIFLNSGTGSGTAQIRIVSSGVNISLNDLPDLGGSYFKQNGNSFGTTAVLGTNDANRLAIETNNVVRAGYDASTGIYNHETSSTVASITQYSSYYNKSTSATDDDEQLWKFTLDDGAGNETIYGQVAVVSTNVTNGSEEGAFHFSVPVAGTLTQTVDMTANGVTLRRNIILDKTITPGGTTGAQTINKTSGSVNFAAAATSLVVTNSLVTSSSIVHCTVATNDTTMKGCACVAGSGSFTIFADAAPTAETRVNFTVTN